MRTMTCLKTATTTEICSLLRPLACAAALALVPSLASGELTKTALGNAGELFELRAGTYGDLVPGGRALAANVPILVLDLGRPGQPVQRLIVPGSEGPSLDRAAWMLYDKPSDILSILWQTSSPADGTKVLLTDFHAGEWSAAQTLFAGTVPPLLALTHDTFTIRISEDQSVKAERHILHLVWQEQQPPKVKYSPVIFVEGRYVGWQEVFVLSDLRPADEPAPAQPLAAGLRRSVTLETGDDSESVSIAFADSQSAQIRNFNIRILPLELAFLSDEIRKRVLAEAAEFDPEDPASFADHMRFEIIGMGATFGLHPQVVAYVGEQVSSKIRQDGGGYGSDEIMDLASDLRDYTINLTASLFGIQAISGGDGQIIEIDIGGLLGGNPTSGPAQLLDLHLTASLAAPAAVRDLPATILPSADGAELLISWQDSSKNLYFYVESQGSGWSEPRTLQLTGEMNVQKAEKLLRQRIR